MKDNYKIVQQLFYLVAIVYSLQYLGTILKSDLIKYVAVVAQIYLLILTFTTIKKNARNINWHGIPPLLYMVFLFPLIRIFGNVIYDLSVRNFIDGILINGSYYLLGFTGMAMASISNSLNIFKLVYKFGLITFPLAIIIFILPIFNFTSEYKQFTGLLVIVSFLIPIATLVLRPINNKYSTLGWFAIFAILYMSSVVSSRSYTLVGVYFIILALKYHLSKQRTFVVLFLLLIFYGSYSIGLFDFLNKKAETQEISMSDKFRFNELFKTFDKFTEDGDITRIFYWEGNSRSEILIDAFGKFTIEDWIFGRGIFGRYVSFTNRHTIEIGLAQEIFRWGLPYGILSLYFFINTYIKLKKRRLISRNPTIHLLYSIVLIKILDMFVYGMPESSPYTLLMFWAMMCLYVKGNRLIDSNVNGSIKNKLASA